MSILNANGSIACAKCGENARAERNQLKAENKKLRKLLQKTWDIFHDATAREFIDTKTELRELGIEVD